MKKRGPTASGGMPVVKIWARQGKGRERDGVPFPIFSCFRNRRDGKATGATLKGFLKSYLKSKKSSILRDGRGKEGKATKGGGCYISYYKKRSAYLSFPQKEEDMLQPSNTRKGKKGGGGQRNKGSLNLGKRLSSLSRKPREGKALGNKKKTWKSIIYYLRGGPGRKYVIKRVGMV